jgi:hypothetical protein
VASAIAWEERVAATSVHPVKMIEGNFKSEVLEAEIVVAHEQTGHIFRFPILSNGTISLHGSKIEANPLAQSEANRLVFAAYGAARAAISQSQARSRREFMSLFLFNYLAYATHWRAARESDENYRLIISL